MAFKSLEEKLKNYEELKERLNVLINEVALKLEENEKKYGEKSDDFIVWYYKGAQDILVPLKKIIEED